MPFIWICSGLINRILWYLLKRLLKWANKKWKNFNIYNIVLLKTSGDIIILHLCTRNLDDMIYTSWDIECDRLKLVIMGHFSFTPPALELPKIRILKKWKKMIEISFYICVPKTTIIWGMVPEIRSWALFSLLPTNSPQKQNFEK